MIVTITVKPGSKKGPVLEQVKGAKNEYIAFVREKAHDGEANKAVLELISDYFSVPKSCITIKTGVKFRKKVVEIVEK